MGRTDIYTNLCKKCFIRVHNLNKKHVDKIVLSEEKCKCDKCGMVNFIVDYVED